MNDEEEIEIAREQFEDEDLDTKILHLLVTMIGLAQVLIAHQYLKLKDYIEYPIRRPITRIGYDYIHNVLREDPQHFRQLYRMFPDVFLKLCKLIRDTTHLKDTRFICVEEMVATFLITVGQNSRYCHTIDTFKRSKFATSTNFHKVLRAINTIAPSLMAKPNLVVASKIRESTRFYPYFKDCLGAIDGTHIPAMVSNSQAPSYRNRKGVISQNVLAACNFDMEFIYVLSGWEGSAHDSKVLYDALTRRSNKFVVPQGKFYLADCGFANRRKFLAPFRATKYHLQEFTGQGCDPETPHELFNHRHASLRNVIERIFGVFKSRFLIFKSAPPFPYKTQAEVVLACVALHNFLRKHCRSDEFPVEEVDGVIDEENMEGNTPFDGSQNNEEILETQDQEREGANIWRETMAQQMWRDATSN